MQTNNSHSSRTKRWPFAISDREDAGRVLMRGCVVACCEEDPFIRHIRNHASGCGFDWRWEQPAVDPVGNSVGDDSYDIVLFAHRGHPEENQLVDSSLASSSTEIGTVFACWAFSSDTTGTCPVCTLATISPGLGKGTENESRAEHLRNKVDFLYQGIPTCDQVLQVLTVAKRWKHASAAWREAAERDGLTGLSRQSELFRWISQWWKPDAADLQRPVSCVMLDVDYFKRVNDVWGHPAGDLVLRTMGQLLQAHCPPGALASRYGGEEFCIILPGYSEQEAVEFSESLRLLISAQEMPIEETVLRVTASFGVAERLPDIAHPAQLINLADRCLLLAKRNRRNRVVCHSAHPANQNTLGHTEGDSDSKPMSAQQVMIPVVGGLKADLTAADAIDYFLRLRINFAPVVDEKQVVVGLLSERDLLAVMLSKEWPNLHVRDIMSPNVVCFEDDASLSEISDFLCRASCSAVVVTSHGKVVGMVTLSSLLRWLNNLAESQRTDFEDAWTAGKSHLTQIFDQASQISNAICQEAGRLSIYMKRHDENWLPALISGSSRLQELVSDLLACAHDPSEKICPGIQTQKGLASILAMQEGLLASDLASLEGGSI